MSQETTDIVINSQHHDARDYKQAQLQAHGLNALRHRSPDYCFYCVVKQMPPIEHRNWQKVQHPETDTQHCEKAEIDFQTVACCLPRDLGNCNRAIYLILRTLVEYVKTIC